MCCFSNLQLAHSIWIPPTHKDTHEMAGFYPAPSATEVREFCLATGTHFPHPTGKWTLSLHLLPVMSMSMSGAAMRTITIFLAHFFAQKIYANPESI